jgi:hypothetical protein
MGGAKAHAKDVYRTVLPCYSKLVQNVVESYVETMNATGIGMLGILILPGLSGMGKVRADVQRGLRR